MTVMTVLTVSCGDKMPQLKPEDTSVKGKLGDYYHVVDRSYRVVCEGEIFKSYILSVELQRTEEELPFDTESATYYTDSDDDFKTYVGFGIEILDKDGNVLQTEQATGYNWYRSDVENLLGILPNETGILRWEIESENLAKAKSFRVTSAIKENADYGSSTVATSTYDTDSGNNWDSVLDEYERLVDSYISLYQKAMAGDMAAMSDYVGVLESAEALEAKLETAQSNLSASQSARYVRIVNKLANAAF